LQHASITGVIAGFVACASGLLFRIFDCSEHQWEHSLQCRALATADGTETRGDRGLLAQKIRSLVGHTKPGRGELNPETGIVIAVFCFPHHESKLNEPIDLLGDGPGCHEEGAEEICGPASVGFASPAKSKQYAHVRAADLVPLATESIVYNIDLLLQEVSTSINTAAAGGNASLLACA